MGHKVARITNISKSAGGVQTERTPRPVRPRRIHFGRRSHRSGAGNPRRGLCRADGPEGTTSSAGTDGGGSSGPG